MPAPRAGPAARNLRVAAIISITLEYKMRVINFITNYVGPAGAHFNLTANSGSQSQLELESRRVAVESQLNVKFFSFYFFVVVLPMSLAHGSHAVSLSVHRAVNHNPFRLPSTYKSNSLSFRADLWQQ